MVQPDGGTECPRCGIVFEKYASRHRSFTERPAATDNSRDTVKTEDSPERDAASLRNLLFSVDPDPNLLYVIGRVVVFLILVGWGLKFMVQPITGGYAGRSFMHMVNLPFHEAGHVLFRPFGQFIMMTGGSLMQVLVPFVCLLVFLFRTRDTFAASVALWWMGESLIDLAPYINDARALKMILLGGVTGRDVQDYHDWEFILRKLGMLEYDHALAYAAKTIGSLFMLCTFAWGGFLLYRQIRNSLSSPGPGS
jgi:hypothetical protein